MEKTFKFGADGHTFTADVSTTMGDREFTWTAEVSLGGRKIGTLTGRIRKETIAIGSWDEGFLAAVAHFEVEEAVKRRDGISW